MLVAEGAQGQQGKHLPRSRADDAELHDRA
jgi:hypothetical protein